jgi:TolA-binding protein
MEAALRIGPETPPTSEELAHVRDAYAAVLERYPLAAESAPADSNVTRGIANARAQAQMGLVRIHRARGEFEDALRILREAEGAYPWDLSATLQFRSELVEELSAAGQIEEAARICQSMAADLPARTPDGEPIVPVQDAPLRAADFLVQVGLQEEAILELDRAEIYYRSLIDENPRDKAAALAWVQLCSVEARRGRFDRAAEALEEARRAPGAGDLQARILFILGVLQQEGRQDPRAAAATFHELVTRFPETPAAPEAIVRQAACLADTGESERALELLREVRETYPRDGANAARARLLAARILTGSQRWQEALSEYRALQADHPRSPQAIGSPFEIAQHYRESGVEEAARATLERAVEENDRLREDYAGTPLARMLDEASVRALVQLERWEQAVERLLRFPTLYPRDPRNPMSTIEAAAILADRIGDRKRAVSLLEELAETYPESALARQAREQARRILAN